MRLVPEQQIEHGSQWASSLSATAKIGGAAPSLHRWVSQAERDLCKRAGLSSTERDRLLRRENSKWKYVEVRCSEYLNNIVEQDNRVIRRCCASITISGIELAHRIHKRQFSLGFGRRPQHWSVKQQWERALA